jgi:hypothetical protein
MLLLSCAAGRTYAEAAPATELDFVGRCCIAAATAATAAAAAAGDLAELLVCWLFPLLCVLLLCCSLKSRLRARGLLSPVIVSIQF